MKKVTLTLTVLFFILSCNKETISPKISPAKLSINVGVKIVEMDVYKVKKSTSAVEDYKVEIYNSNDELVVEYDRAADMPESIELDPGVYTVIAHSNNLSNAAFNAPYYRGELEVTLTEGESKTETVTCTLANCAVRIVYSQNIVDGFDTYTTVVRNNDGGSLTYDEDETRLGYFSLSPISIEATLTNSSETKTLTGSITNPEAQKLYEIQLDASASDGTGLSITLIEDGTTSTEVISIEEGAVTGREPGAGDLIISEIMANPDELSDSEGEYIEIYNTASEAINLNGLIFKEGTSTEFTINEDIIISTNNYATIAKSDQVTFTPNYITSSISLINSSTTGGRQYGLYFEINEVETEIFSLNYLDGNFPSISSGASLELSTNHLNATDAANGVNWCTAVSGITSDGDLGTPGMANDCSN